LIIFNNKSNNADTSDCKITDMGDGIKHINKNGTDHIIAERMGDFKMYFDKLTDNLKQKWLETHDPESWEELENFRTLKICRMHHFNDSLYAMVRFVFLHHVVTLNNLNVFYDFDFRVDDGTPLCAVGGCLQPPQVIISKVTNATLSLVGVLLCAGHGKIINEKDAMIHQVIDARIMGYLSTNPKQEVYFPEYVAQIKKEGEENAHPSPS